MQALSAVTLPLHRRARLLGLSLYSAHTGTRRGQLLPQRRNNTRIKTVVFSIIFGGGARTDTSDVLEIRPFALSLQMQAHSAVTLPLHLAAHGC